MVMARGSQKKKREDMEIGIDRRRGRGKGKREGVGFEDCEDYERAPAVVRGVCPVGGGVSVPGVGVVAEPHVGAAVSPVPVEASSISSESSEPGQGEKLWGSHYGE